MKLIDSKYTYCKQFQTYLSVSQSVSDQRAMTSIFFLVLCKIAPTRIGGFAALIIDDANKSIDPISTPYNKSDIFYSRYFSTRIFETHQIRKKSLKILASLFPSTFNVIQLRIPISYFTCDLPTLYRICRIEWLRIERVSSVCVYMCVCAFLCFCDWNAIFFYRNCRLIDFGSKSASE